MNILPVKKFGFRIRTRGGAEVDNLSILGNDQAEAERKLRQIYPGCEVLEIRQQIPGGARNGTATFEEVVDLISAG